MTNATIQKSSKMAVEKQLSCTKELRLPPYIFLETLDKFARDALYLSFMCWHLWAALMVTCYSETPHNDMVRLMIQSGADKYKGQLQWTANSSSTDGYLLDEGAPVNTQDVNGTTSLSKLSQRTVINLANRASNRR